MKANELRIGNLVNLCAFDRPGKVYYLSESRVSIKLDKSRIKTDYNGISPIPLTEQWLVRLGFEKDDGHVHIDNPTREYSWIKMILPVNEFTIVYDFQSACTHKDYHQGHKKILLVGNGGRDDEGEMELNIKYINQLQNIYFALTNKELTIRDV